MTLRRLRTALIVLGLFALVTPLTPRTAAAAVVQDGSQNYAGPTCPGAGWTCTKDTDVVQTGSHNVFECTDNTCKAVQKADPGGNNEARCAQSTRRKSVQECDVDQSNDTGANSIDATQSATVSSKGPKVVQSSGQVLKIAQTNGAGRNDLAVRQSVELSAKHGRGKKKHSHVQDAVQTLDAKQRSTSGHQGASIDQTQSLSSQIKGKQSVQRQSANDNAPDIVATVLQHTGSGRNDLGVRQKQLLDQSTGAGRAVQLQGADEGGESFESDVDSDKDKGGYSDVVVTQQKRWTQEAGRHAKQSQVDKLRVTTLGLTPNTVKVDQSSDLGSGAEADQRCIETAQVRARDNGSAHASCTVDDGTGKPIVKDQTKTGTDFTLENRIDPDPPTPSPSPGTSPSPSASPGPTATPSGSPSASPGTSPSPSASPSTSPSTSPSASPSPDPTMGTIAGVVKDATTAAPISGATVAIIERLNVTTSAADGSYSLSVLPGTYTVRAAMPGYAISDRSVTVAAGQTAIVDFNLSPTLAPGQARVVLTWTDSDDLDAHLWLPPTKPYHIAYYDRGHADTCPNAQLDVDDRDGNGPETITISQGHDGTYQYAVNKFSGNASLSQSNAIVLVFDQFGLRATFAVPTTGGPDDDWWHVADLTFAGGALTSVTAGSGVGASPPQPDVTQESGCVAAGPPAG